MGIKEVLFYIDEVFIGKDTSAPYSLYCSIKHFGVGEIRAVGVGNDDRAGEDTLDIWYYKFL